MTRTKKAPARKMERSPKPREKDVNCLSVYFREINYVPLLSREEEEKTALKAAEGNLAAKEKLIKANLRFVIRVARRYVGSGLPFEDLISEGNLGLLKAIDYFDVKKGYHFISYAVWWIRHYIMKAISEKTRLIRLPQYKIDALARIRAMKENTPAGQSENLEIAETARLLKMDRAEIAELIMLEKEPIYFGSQVLGNDSSAVVEDFIRAENIKTPDEAAIEQILRDEIESALSCLGERDADIIRCRFGLKNAVPMSLEELGARYKISKEGVRQIESKALRRLHDSGQCSMLAAYIS